jgi:hypothetical protein
VLGQLFLEAAELFRELGMHAEAAETLLKSKVSTVAYKSCLLPSRKGMLL